MLTRLEIRKRALAVAIASFACSKRYCVSINEIKPLYRPAYGRSDLVEREHIVADLRRAGFKPIGYGGVYETGEIEIGDLREWVNFEEARIREKQREKQKQNARATLVFVRHRNQSA